MATPPASAEPGGRVVCPVRTWYWYRRSDRWFQNVSAGSTRVTRSRFSSVRRLCVSDRNHLSDRSIRAAGGGNPDHLYRSDRRQVKTLPPDCLRSDGIGLAAPVVAMAWITMIDLLLLGNGGMMPMPNRWLSSLLVRIQGNLILFDCGEGTQIPWQTTGWGFKRLGTICLSHLHADHVAGLPGLFHAVANAGREDPVVIYGPPGTNRVVSALREIAPFLSFEIRIREVDEGERLELPGGVEMTVARGDHSLPCNLYRLNVERAADFWRRKRKAPVSRSNCGANCKRVERSNSRVSWCQPKHFSDRREPVCRSGS